MTKGRISKAVIAAIAIVSLVPATSLAKTLDSTKLKAKPGNYKTKISAVSKGEKIYVTIEVKKKGKYRELDRDKASSVAVGDGQVAIDADQDGESYSKNGGEGLLSVGDDFNEYFNWNAKRGRINFYD